MKTDIQIQAENLIEAGEDAQLHAFLKEHPEVNTQGDCRETSLLMYSLFAHQPFCAGLCIRYRNEFTPFELVACGLDTDLERLSISDSDLLGMRNPEGYSLLQLAARFGQDNMVQLLFNKGVDLNQVNLLDQGYSALQYAIAFNHSSTILMLLEMGADIRLRNSIGEDALELARKAGDLEIIQRLHQAG